MMHHALHVGLLDAPACRASKSIRAALCF